MHCRVGWSAITSVGDFHHWPTGEWRTTDFQKGNFVQRTDATVQEFVQNQSKSEPEKALSYYRPSGFPRGVLVVTGRRTSWPLHCGTSCGSGRAGCRGRGESQEGDKKKTVLARPNNGANARLADAMVL